MKRLTAPLVVLVLLVCGCSKKDSPAAQRLNGDEPLQIQAKEPEIKAATPEDPGPIATVVGPMTVWEQQAGLAQTQREDALRRQLHPADRLVHVEAKPEHFLHRVFSLSDHTQFSFVVPPHQANTRLRGTFRSFTKRGDPDSTSDRTADVDLLLLNEQEFNEFLQGEPQSVTYELDSSHNQLVDWRVPMTYKEPQTYHLIFGNSEGGTRIKFVEADFTVSFE
jgi:hypothetical protein